MFLFTFCWEEISLDNLQPISDSIILNADTIIETKVSGIVLIIDPNGNDNTGNGSKASPWKSLYKACIETTKPGATIHVNAGTYLETSVCKLAPGVNIEGDGKALSKIICSANENDYTAQLFLFSETADTKGNQTIQNIWLDGNNLEASVGIEVIKRSNVKILNCKLTNFRHKGIVFGGIGDRVPSVWCVDNEVSRCEIYNCAGYVNGSGEGAIYLGGQDGFEISYCDINQTQRSSGQNGFPIKLFNGDGYNRGIQIHHNTITKAPYDGTWDFAIEVSQWDQGGLHIYNNTIDGNIDLGSRRKTKYDYSAYIHHNILGKAVRSNSTERGIIIENVSNDLYITHNYFHNLSNAIVISTTYPSDSINNLYIQYNIFDKIGVSSNSYNSYGIQVYNEVLKFSNWYIDNNVFTGNTSNNGGRVGFALPSKGKGRNIRLRNNIFIDFDLAWLDGSSTGSLDGLWIQNNIAYNCGNNNNPSYKNGYQPINITSQNNKFVNNPMFISTNDFRLQFGSPAINSGIDVGLKIDFGSNSVGSPPEIGVYEYK